MDVAVVNCPVGNVRSVVNAVTALGAGARLTRDPDDIGPADRVILPGVGAFQDAMDFLESHGLDTALRARAAAGKPLMGICLGFQLLCRNSDENGRRTGLGLLDAVVRRIPDHGLRLPHIGWNNIDILGAEPFDGTGDSPCFYFAHSYHVIPDDPTSASSTVQYGERLVASIHDGPVSGTQFHPEKSHRVGLRVLDNFLHPGRAESGATIDEILAGALSDDRLVRGEEPC